MKVTRVCLVLAGALSLAGIGYAAAAPEAAWRKNCDGARQAFQQGKYAEAEKLLLAAGFDKTNLPIPWLDGKRLRLVFG